MRYFSQYFVISKAEEIITLTNINVIDIHVLIVAKVHFLKQFFVDILFIITIFYIIRLDNLFFSLFCFLCLILLFN